MYMIKHNAFSEYEHELQEVKRELREVESQLEDLLQRQSSLTERQEQLEAIINDASKASSNDKQWETKGK